MGRGLYRLQMGEEIGMPNSRPMPGIAAGVSELRVKSADGSYRTFYYTAAPQGILVFHAFARRPSERRPLKSS